MGGCEDWRQYKFGAGAARELPQATKMPEIGVAGFC